MMEVKLSDNYVSVLKLIHKLRNKQKFHGTEKSEVFVLKRQIYFRTTKLVRETLGEIKTTLKS